MRACRRPGSMQRIGVRGARSMANPRPSDHEGSSRVPGDRPRHAPSAPRARSRESTAWTRAPTTDRQSAPARRRRRRSHRVSWAPVAAVAQRAIRSPLPRAHLVPGSVGRGSRAKAAAPLDRFARSTLSRNAARERRGPAHRRTTTHAPRRRSVRSRPARVRRDGGTCAAAPSRPRANHRGRSPRRRSDSGSPHRARSVLSSSLPSGALAPPRRSRVGSPGAGIRGTSPAASCRGQPAIR